MKELKLKTMDSNPWKMDSILYEEQMKRMLTRFESLTTRFESLNIELWKTSHWFESLSYGFESHFQNKIEGWRSNKKIRIFELWIWIFELWIRISPWHRIQISKVDSNPSKTCSNPPFVKALNAWPATQTTQNFKSNLSHND